MFGNVYGQEKQKQNNGGIIGNVLGSISPLLGMGFKFLSSAWARNRENEYNSPKAQIARLREAGLSPGMMYGGGHQVSQDAGFQDQGLDLMKELGTFQTTQLQKQQARQSKLQTELLRQQVRSAAAEADIKRVEADWKKQYTPGIQIPTIDGETNIIGGSNLAVDLALERELKINQSSYQKHLAWMQEKDYELRKADSEATRDRIKEEIALKQKQQVLAEAQQMLTNQQFEQLKYEFDKVKGLDEFFKSILSKFKISEERMKDLEGFGFFVKSIIKTLL